MKEISFLKRCLPLKDKLFRLASALLSTEREARDIVQDTLIKVSGTRATMALRMIPSASATNYRKNLSPDRIKKMENQNGSLEDEKTERRDATWNPSERMIQKDKLDIVKKMIDELPEKQRSCIQLRDIEGKAYKDIALILGITEEQVKINIFRARQTIKQRFQQFDKYGL